MAGIGFELRRLMTSEGDLVSRVRGYGSAGLIAAGPWVMTIITLSALTAFAPLFADRHDFQLFRTLVTYCFAFSLIVVGLAQMSFTRRTADLLYAREYDRLLPAFSTGAIAIAGIQLLIGVVFCIVAALPVHLAIATILLYVITSLTWQALIWLSATKDFNAIVAAFAWGCVVSLAGVAVLGFNVFKLTSIRIDSATGLLVGYTMGAGLTLVLLVRAVVHQTSVGGRPDMSILKSLKTYPRLALVGLTYNIAIWIDEIIVWFSDGQMIHTLIHFHPTYDTCRFFAYLTVIPALAVNLVLVETSFYEHYRSFYGSILRDFPLNAIRERRESMLADLRNGTVRILRIQGAITLLALVFAPNIIAWLKLPDAMVTTFRCCCVGAFFHVLLLITILIQLYLDLRGTALATTVTFLVANTGFAIAGIYAGPSAYGLGYAAAAFISLVVGYVLLMKKCEKLAYLTFTNQPSVVEPVATEHA